MNVNKLQYKCEMREDTLNIDIFDEIGEVTDALGFRNGGFTSKQLKGVLDETKAKNIVVRINSKGGDLFEGITIYNLLKGATQNITVEVVGLAASSASIIAMGGNTVRMYDTSQMMIHNCWVVTCGNSKELRKVADDMDKIMESAKCAYLAKSGDKLTPELLDDLLDAEAYLSADECLELGLIDEIISTKETPKEGIEKGGQEKEDTAKNVYKADNDTETPESVATHWFF